jgi:hypothetical protein
MMAFQSRLGKINEINSRSKSQNEKYHQWSQDEMLEVVFEKDDDFLKIKETLTRIGVASNRDKTLYQSTHILHKRGHYYIVHFKELFALDGKSTNIDISDIERRNAIVKLLVEWNLLTVVNEEQLDPMGHIGQFKVISFKDKKNWELIPKYTIGVR